MLAIPVPLFHQLHLLRRYSKYSVFQASSYQITLSLVLLNAVVNTSDAQSRGIKDGDLVRVFNDRGEMVIPARVTQRIMPGVVDIPEGAWYTPDEHGVDQGGCANVLTRDEASPAGAFAVNTCVVQVLKV